MTEKDILKILKKSKRFMGIRKILDEFDFSHSLTNEKEIEGILKSLYRKNKVCFIHDLGYAIPSNRVKTYSGGFY